MSEGDTDKAKAKQFFEKHIRSNREIDDLSQLDGLFSHDPTVLRSLQAHCMGAARKAAMAGHHTEGRRFGNLARQFQKLAEEADGN